MKLVLTNPKELLISSTHRRILKVKGNLSDFTSDITPLRPSTLFTHKDYPYPLSVLAYNLKKLNYMKSNRLEVMIIFVNFQYHSHFLYEVFIHAQGMPPGYMPPAFLWLFFDLAFGLIQIIVFLERVPL